MFKSDPDAAASTRAAVPPGAGFRAATPAPTMPSRSPWLYVYIPERWDVIGGKVLPILGVMRYIPGLNGADQKLDRQTGALISVQMSGARVHHAERGRMVLAHDLVPDEWADASGVKSYLMNPEGRPDVWLSVFERSYPGSDQIESDLSRYVEWLEWLISAGHIPACPLHLLRKIRDRKYESWVQATAAAEKNSALAGQAKVAADVLRIVEAAIEEREAAAKASSAAKRPAKTRAAAPPPADG